MQSISNRPRTTASTQTGTRPANLLDATQQLLNERNPSAAVRLLLCTPGDAVEPLKRILMALKPNNEAPINELPLLDPDAQAGLQTLVVFVLMAELEKPSSKSLIEVIQLCPTATLKAVLLHVVQAAATYDKEAEQLTKIMAEVEPGMLHSVLLEMRLPPDEYGQFLRLIGENSFDLFMQFHAALGANDLNDAEGTLENIRRIDQTHPFLVPAAEALSATAASWIGGNDLIVRFMGHVDDKMPTAETVNQALDYAKLMLRLDNAQAQLASDFLSWLGKNWVDLLNSRPEQTIAQKIFDQVSFNALSAVAAQAMYEANKEHSCKPIEELIALHAELTANKHFSAARELRALILQSVVHLESDTPLPLEAMLTLFDSDADKSVAELLLLRDWFAAARTLDHLSVVAQQIEAKRDWERETLKAGLDECSSRAFAHLQELTGIYKRGDGSWKFPGKPIDDWFGNLITFARSLSRDIFLYDTTPPLATQCLNYLCSLDTDTARQINFLSLMTELLGTRLNFGMTDKIVDKLNCIVKGAVDENDLSGSISLLKHLSDKAQDYATHQNTKFFLPGVHLKLAISCEYRNLWKHLTKEQQQQAIKHVKETIDLCAGNAMAYASSATWKTIRELREFLVAMKN